MILFFLRRYNDIDHTVPIIYRMAKDGHRDFEVYCLNLNIDIKNDFRLAFLRNTFHVPIKYVYQAYMPSPIHRMVIFFIRRLALSDSIESPFVKFLKRAQKRLFDENWAFKMLEHKKASILILDKQHPKKYITCHLIAGAKKLQLPLVAVHHGISMYINDDWTTVAHDTVGYNDFRPQLDDFDAFLVQFERFRQAIIRGGVPPEKVVVLGSTRFCQEWRDVYLNLVPKSELSKQKNDLSKLRIVLMDHSSEYRIDPRVVVNTVRRLSALDFVDLVVKPTTATHVEKKGGISSQELCAIAKVDYHTHSIELIRWADVVMGTTSSILLEPLLMGKLFIYPKYFHKNEMLWEVKGASWTVNSYEELEAALRTIKKLSDYKPYSQEDVNQFITEVVYGGQADRDVLGDHVKFILSHAKSIN